METAVIKKFWERVEKTDTCWNWTGRVGTEGSVIIPIPPARYLNARTISLRLHGKAHAKRARFIVSCKNRFCVNPEHLLTGDAARFWSKVQKLDEPNGCWAWTGYLDEKMYGTFRLPSRQMIKAHVYSWYLHTGIRPKALCVCHKCDHPWCVNPDHLFLGSNQDNVDDKVAKKRHLFGTKNHMAKLDDEKVREIRRLHKSGMSAAAISRLYLVSDETILSIIHHKAWRHVED